MAKLWIDCEFNGFGGDRIEALEYQLNQERKAHEKCGEIKRRDI